MVWHQLEAWGILFEVFPKTKRRYADMRSKEEVKGRLPPS